MRQMLSILASIAVMGATAVSQAQTPPPTEPSTPGQATPIQGQTTSPKDIIDTASDQKDFKTFNRLVRLAGLDASLRSKPTQTDPDAGTVTTPSTYTVFAPTDEAFAKLPAGALDALEKNPDLLKKILQYHVVSGTVNATDLKDGAKLKTLNGEEVSVSLTGEKPKIGTATVTKADVKSTNGVIHAIDTVLVPPSLMKTVYGDGSR